MKPSWLVALALVSGLTLPGTRARGQAVPTGNDPSPTKTFSKQPVFQLPIILKDKDRVGLREILLFCKSNGSDWVLQNRVPPNQPFFACRVPQDGEYWYSVATVDGTGRQAPPDVSRTAPDVIVVVDTQPPEVEVKPLPVRGKDLVQCVLHDANPDYAALKMEYQAGDKSWRLLEPVPNSPGVYNNPKTNDLTGWVRVSASDRAGNKIMREIDTLAGVNSRPGTGGIVQTGALSSGPQLPDLTSHNSLPAERKNPSQGRLLPAETKNSSQGMPANNASAQSGPVLPGSKEAPKPDPAVPQSRQLYNLKHVSLNYEIVHLGSSGIGKVEVWMTRDKGHSWQVIAEDQDKTPPVEFDLPEDGLYGIRVIATNGTGFSKPPPGEGDVPDLWLEIDTQKPEVHLQRVQPTGASEAPTIILSWIANDKNLKPEPVDLFYSHQPEGPWIPIAQGLAKEGSYSWPVLTSVGLPRYYLRVLATDLADNKGVGETKEPLILDLLVPTVRGLQISSKSGQ